MDRGAPCSALWPPRPLSSGCVPIATVSGRHFRLNHPQCARRTVAVNLGSVAVIVVEPSGPVQSFAFNPPAGMLR